MDLASLHVDHTNTKADSSFLWPAVAAGGGGVTAESGKASPDLEACLCICCVPQDEIFETAILISFQSYRESPRATGAKNSGVPST